MASKFFKDAYKGFSYQLFDGVWLVIVTVADGKNKFVKKLIEILLTFPFMVATTHEDICDAIFHFPYYLFPD